MPIPGERNRAAVPVPSIDPACGGFPATVVTTPVSVTCRIAAFPVSATYNTLLPPEKRVPIPFGALKRAAFPVPSAEPLLPARPAGVVTSPDCVTCRIVLFPVSATNRTEPSVAIPPGLLNCAGPGTVSPDPGEPGTPANVVTTPSIPDRSACRITWFPVSEM